MAICRYDEKVNGQWRYYIRTYIKDSNGISKQITRRNKDWLGNEGKKLAQAEENRLINSSVAKESQKTVNSKLTINELFELYITSKNKKIDDDSLYLIKKDTTAHFLKTEGKNLVVKYTQEKYKKWQDFKINDTYEKGKDEFGAPKLHNYSLKFLNEIHRYVCEMFQLAVNRKIIEENCPKQVGLFGTKKQRTLEKRDKKWNIISYDNYLELMKETEENKKYNLMFDLFFSEGPRPGELMAFRWVDYDEENSKLKVNYTLTKKGNGPRRLKEPKTPASKDYLPLDDNLNEKLKKYKKECMKERDFSNTWFIFGKEKPISEHAIDNAINKYIKKTGLSSEFRKHDFRHSFASWLFSMKLPLPYISKRMRHASISETLKTYTHIIPEDYYNYNNFINDFKKNEIKQDQKQDQSITQYQLSSCF